MAWFLCCISFGIQSREKEVQTACHPSRERDYFTYCFYGLLWCFLWVCTFQQFNSAALKCRLVGILAPKVVSIISILNFLSWSCHDCWFILLFIFFSVKACLLVVWKTTGLPIIDQGMIMPISQAVSCRRLQKEMPLTKHNPVELKTLQVHQ